MSSKHNEEDYEIKEIVVRQPSSLARLFSFVTKFAIAPFMIGTFMTLGVGSGIHKLFFHVKSRKH